MREAIVPPPVQERVVTKGGRVDLVELGLPITIELPRSVTISWSASTVSPLPGGGLLGGPPGLRVIDDEVDRSSAFLRETGTRIYVHRAAREVPARLEQAVAALVAAHEKDQKELRELSREGKQLGREGRSVAHVKDIADSVDDLADDLDELADDKLLIQLQKQTANGWELMWSPGDGEPSTLAVFRGDLGVVCGDVMADPDRLRAVLRACRSMAAAGR